jgi:3-oxoacyl-[acyl-carrier-protein] synthase III
MQRLIIKHLHLNRECLLNVTGRYGYAASCAVPQSIIDTFQHGKNEASILVAHAASGYSWANSAFAVEPSTLVPIFTTDFLFEDGLVSYQRRIQ